MYAANASAELRKQANEAGVRFVLTEVETALSFLDIADLTSNPDRRQRMVANAKKAHDAIQHFSPRLVFSESEASSVKRGLQQIRGRLRRRGIRFDDHPAVATTSVA